MTLLAALVAHVGRLGPVMQAMESAFAGSLRQQTRLEEALACLKEYRAGTAAGDLVSGLVPLNQEQLKSWRQKQVGHACMCSSPLVAASRPFCALSRGLGCGSSGNMDFSPCAPDQKPHLACGAVVLGGERSPRLAGLAYASALLLCQASFGSLRACLLHSIVFCMQLAAGICPSLPVGSVSSPA